jgi:chaperonin GroES
MTRIRILSLACALCAAFPVAAVQVLPANRHLVVRPDAASDRRAPQGIILPEGVRSGEVVSLGPTVELVVPPSASHPDPQVKPGDDVLFGKYAGSELHIGGEDLLILREDEVVGVVQD